MHWPTGGKIDFQVVSVQKGDLRTSGAISEMEVYTIIMGSASSFRKSETET